MVEVSVIIPTYNRKHTLGKALDSVLVQEEIPFEVIIVDDGSTDGTFDFVQSHYPQVTLLTQKNLGPSAARNHGIKQSRGEWIAFLDSDDEWLPGKLRAQLSFFANNPSVRICQTEEIWIRNGIRVNPMKKHKKISGNIFESSLALCLVSPSCSMIHRELLDEVGLFDESLPACEDYDLWLRIAAKHSFGLIETPYVVRYGGHQDQTSAKYPVMDRYRIQSLVKILSLGILNAAQTNAAEKMLLEKSNIVLEGARKRGNAGMIQEIETLLRTSKKTG